MGKYLKKTKIKCIAIAGPSASGKSVLAERLCGALGRDRCAIICQDDYYRDWSHLPKCERKKINFDDLKSFDQGLLLKHLKGLRNGRPIMSPKYDFVQSRRLKKTGKVEPKQFIIVEGLMPYVDNKLRGLFDYKIYIDTGNAVCLARRIKRDTEERGDTVESVCKRYFNDVLPMQKKYVEPQRKWSDLVIGEKWDRHHFSVGKTIEK